MSRDNTSCDCEFCKNDHDFALDPELMAELLSGKAAVFAGAGVSTESRSVLKSTFYEVIASELGESFGSLSFPDLMEKYCQQPNGRIKLLRAIIDRLNHIDSFPELARVATRFHRELGTFYPVRDIITTNWDTYFERSCHATPFVTDPDLALWEAADRRVLKIHGSVTNLGSIVATTTDYEECQRRLDSGMIGSRLKTILASQTVVFVGYSFSDPDFAAIYAFVRNQMDSLRRQAYVVTPFDEDCERFAAEGFIPIRTDARFFFEQVKVHAVSQGVMLGDHVYAAAADLLDVVQGERDQLRDNVKLDECPEAIYAASYQDGMAHALERAIQMRGTGQYSEPCRMHRKVLSYLDWRKEKRRQRNYEDVAYIEGYANALTYLLIPAVEREDVEVPLYFIFGVEADIFGLPGFLELLAAHPQAHKAALERAQRHVKRLSSPDSVAYYHPPWL